jgi:hypothetical protein
MFVDRGGTKELKQFASTSTRELKELPLDLQSEPESLFARGGFYAGLARILLHALVSISRNKALFLETSPSKGGHLGPPLLNGNSGNLHHYRPILPLDTRSPNNYGKLS